MAGWSECVIILASIQGFTLSEVLNIQRQAVYLKTKSLKIKGYLVGRGAVKER